MKTQIHRIRVTQLSPEVQLTAVDLDVLAADVDLALSRVFAWYDHQTWIAEEQNRLQEGSK